MESRYEVVNNKVHFTFELPVREILNDSVEKITEKYYQEFEKLILGFLKQSHSIENVFSEETNG